MAQDKTLGSQPQEDLALFQRTVRKRRELMLCQCEKIASSMKVGRFDGVKTQLKHGGNREVQRRRLLDQKQEDRMAGGGNCTFLSMAGSNIHRRKI